MIKSIHERVDERENQIVIENRNAENERKRSGANERKLAELKAKKAEQEKARVEQKWKRKNKGIVEAVEYLSRFLLGEPQYDLIGGVVITILEESEAQSYGGDTWDDYVEKWLPDKEHYVVIRFNPENKVWDVTSKSFGTYQKRTGGSGPGSIGGLITMPESKIAHTTSGLIDILIDLSARLSLNKKANYSL